MKYALAFFSLTLIFSACVELYGPDHGPDNLIATQGTEQDRIILTWDEVQRAGVYYIYRAIDVDAEYEYLGATQLVSYIDTTIDPEVHYWYIVASAAASGNTETEYRSDPVEGWSIHTFAWSVSTVGFGAAQIRIAENRVRSGVAYVAYAGDTEGPITVSMYENAAWQTLGSDFGAVDGSIRGNFVVAVFGADPVVAFADETAGGKLSLFGYDSTLDPPDWTPLGPSGQGSVSAGMLTVATDDTTMYLAGLVGTVGTDPPFQIQVLSCDAAGNWVSLPSPLGAETDVSHPVLSVSNGNLTIAYEDQTNATSDIVVKSYAGSWSVVDTYATSADIPDGVLDYSVDTGDDTPYVSFIDDALGNLSVLSYNGSTWDDLSPIIETDPLSESLALSVDLGNVYLFYRDLPSGRGNIVKLAAQWDFIPLNDSQTGITGQFNLSSFVLAIYNNRIFAAFAENTTVSVAVYE